MSGDEAATSVSEQKSLETEELYRAALDDQNHEPDPLPSELPHASYPSYSSDTITELGHLYGDAITDDETPSYAENGARPRTIGTGAGFHGILERRPGSRRTVKATARPSVRGVFDDIPHSPQSRVLSLEVSEPQLPPRTSEGERVMRGFSGMGQFTTDIVVPILRMAAVSGKVDWNRVAGARLVPFQIRRWVHRLLIEVLHERSDTGIGAFPYTPPEATEKLEKIVHNWGTSEKDVLDLSQLSNTKEFCPSCVCRLVEVVEMGHTVTDVILPSFEMSKKKKKCSNHTAERFCGREGLHRLVRVVLEPTRYPRLRGLRIPSAETVRFDSLVEHFRRHPGLIRLSVGMPFLTSTSVQAFCNMSVLELTNPCVSNHSEPKPVYDMLATCRAVRITGDVLFSSETMAWFEEEKDYYEQHPSPGTPRVIPGFGHGRRARRLNEHRLESLTVVNNRSLRDNIVAMLPRLYPRLQKIKFSRCMHLRGYTLSTLCRMHLKSLDLSTTGIEDEALPCLMSLTRLERLFMRNIFTDGTRFSVDALLRALMCHPSLQVLTISHLVHQDAWNRLPVTPGWTVDVPKKDMPELVSASSKKRG